MPIPLDGSPPARLDENTVDSLLKPANTSDVSPKTESGLVSKSKVHRAIDSFLLQNGALMRVDDAFRPYGEIGWESNDTYDLSKALPTVVLRNEDFSRIARLIADGPRVELRFDIANQSYPAGSLSNNVVAEIRGTDKQDSIIILGAHIDSWHLATGAIDNAIGCAIMMEAAHILLKSGVHPRRTIRVVLFSGEEQGLLGSQAYVAEHFGTAEAPKSEFHKLDAYLNIDSGTGRIRAANVFGPPSAADFLRPMLKPFEPVGLEGVVAHTVRQLRSTDATTFSWAGLPAIGLSQDPIDYSFTWHSDLDTYDQVLAEDAQEAALEIAVLTFQLADADESVPRFAETEMPSQR